jgi:hypothetical protein
MKNIHMTSQKVFTRAILIIGLTVLFCCLHKIRSFAADQKPHLSHGAAHQPMMPQSAPDASVEQEDFKVIRSLVPVDGFVGNITYDQETGRLWLLSLGPPANTKGPSKLYEIDPVNGAVLAEATMPFLGAFGTPVYIDGFLYVGIPYQSTLYKIAASRERFGTIVKTIPLPTVNDVEFSQTDQVYRYPFIEFSGVTVTPDKHLMIHASDLGELITLNQETGRVLKRVRTLRGLGGITRVEGPHGEFMLIANTDPAGAALMIAMRQFMFRAAHGIVPLSSNPGLLPAMRPETKHINWVLIDGNQGTPLASIEQPNSRAFAGSTSLLKHEKVAGALYGRFTFLALGDEGILTIQWLPRPRT